MVVIVEPKQTGRFFLSSYSHDCLSALRETFLAIDNVYLFWFLTPEFAHRVYMCALSRQL